MEGRARQFVTIAERTLLYAEKGSDRKKNLTVRIGAPYEVTETPEGHNIPDACAGCSIRLDGLSETVPDVYGTDKIQALSLATDIDPLLKRLSKKYDLFWPSGEPYFD